MDLMLTLTEMRTANIVDILRIQRFEAEAGTLKAQDALYQQERQKQEIQVTRERRQFGIDILETAVMAQPTREAMSAKISSLQSEITRLEVINYIFIRSSYLCLISQSLTHFLFPLQRQKQVLKKYETKLVPSERVISLRKGIEDTFAQLSNLESNDFLVDLSSSDEEGETSQSHTANCTGVMSEAFEIEKVPPVDKMPRRKTGRALLLTESEGSEAVDETETQNVGMLSRSPPSGSENSDSEISDFENSLQELMSKGVDPSEAEATRSSRAIAETVKGGEGPTPGPIPSPAKSSTSGHCGGTPTKGEEQEARESVAGAMAQRASDSDPDPEYLDDIWFVVLGIKNPKEEEGSDEFEI